MDQFHHILRIYLPKDAMDRRVNDVINYCRRTGCQEVLLFTTSYDKAPSFVSLPEIELYVTLLQKAADRLRAAGIVISLNVLQTVGHIYFPEALQKDFPFRRRVYADGTVSREGACPLGAELGRWLADAYRIYAGLKPRVMLVDDDFRAFMQGLSCFCPEHLRSMSRQVGRSVKREEIVAAIYERDERGGDLRKAYWEATSSGFTALARQIADVVHSVSPDTRLGGMSAEWPKGAYGQDWGTMLKVLAGPHQPVFRPQIDMYSEGFLRDMPKSFTNPSCFRATLPKNVEFWPEIENYQYGAHAKSAQCTFVEIATTVLQGFDHAALNIFDMYGTPFFDNESLIDLLEKNRLFLDALHTLVPEGNRPQGVRVLVLPEVNAYPTFPDKGDTSFLEKLPNLGLPICHEGPSPWIFLSGRDARQLSDPELESVLEGGALMDSDAAGVLGRRGFSNRIGVKAEECLESDDLGFEEFVLSLTNPTYQGRHFPLRALIAPGDWKKLEDLTENGIEASVIRNYSERKVGPAVLLTENGAGERFAILAWNGLGSRHLIENRMRAEQFRKIFAWIAREPLPCATSPEAPYLWVTCNRTAKGQRIAGIVNLSTDAYSELPLIFGSSVTPRQIQRLDGSGIAIAVMTSQKQVGEETFVNIKTSLGPMELAIFLYD